MDPILSANALAWRLGIPAARLRSIADRTDSHYRAIPLPQGDKVRQLRVPNPELMDIQRRIVRYVLEPIGLRSEVHGGVRGRSARTNATVHLGKPCVVGLDVKSFFDTVRHYMVYRMFRHELGFGRDVAHLLTRLTTLRSRLPQGAPTSTAVANLLLASPVDGPLVEQAERAGIQYTRFVDDITLSGLNPRPLMNVVARLLSGRRLRMHRRRTAKGKSRPKLRIMGRSEAQEVTGLVVNSRSGPSVSHGRRDAVRAAIFHLRGMPAPSLDAEVQSIKGRIAHVRQFNPGEAKRLKGYLAMVLEDIR